MELPDKFKLLILKIKILYIKGLIFLLTPAVLIILIYKFGDFKIFVDLLVTTSLEELISRYLISISDMGLLTNVLSFFLGLKMEELLLSLRYERLYRKIKMSDNFKYR